jgi:S-adenosylmethionine-dependent methyltransferase
MLMLDQRHLQMKWVPLSHDSRRQLTQALKEHFFTNPLCNIRSIDEYLSTAPGQNDLEAHIVGRLDANRKGVIPWLDQASPLARAKILEIGCGTGASTVALSEQGADVLGIDIDEGALRVAEVRCRTSGLTARFCAVSAAEALQRFRGERFDFIIFFAALEHMTLEERLGSLRAAWEALPARAHLVIVECPNRLWFLDDHTSLAPFFHWLPDDLAFQYSRVTPRERFNTLFTEPTEEAKLAFTRWGRGASFHEFEIALDCRVEDLPVVSCLAHFLRDQARTHDQHTETVERRFEQLLHDIYPKAHRGFCLPYLNLSLRKP